jgi:hypothetical protein
VIDPRKQLRVQYPAHGRPAFITDGNTFPVLDLTPEGLRFGCGGHYLPAVGQTVKGTVVFGDGKRCLVAGTVTRRALQRGECTLALTAGIPMARLVAELAWTSARHAA